MSIISFFLFVWLTLSLHTHPVVAQVEGAQVHIDPNHPVEIYYGAPNIFDLTSMVKKLNLTVYPQDKISTMPDPSLGIGSKITITRATPVNITDAKKTTLYHTWSTTVKQVLAENNIELIGQDSVSPEMAQNISYNMIIKITRVADVQVSETQPITYSTIKKNSVDIEKGQTSVQTPGINGKKQVTYNIHRVDGVDVSKTVINTQVLQDPQSEVILIGIGPKLAKSGPYKDIINAAVKSSLNKNYAVNGTALMCLMLKESNGHSTSGYPDGPYQGLFQYDPGFWATASSQAGYGGASITDPTAQIYTTVYQLSHGQSRRWPTWSGCANS